MQHSTAHTSARRSTTTATADPSTATKTGGNNSAGSNSGNASGNISEEDTASAVTAGNAGSTMDSNSSNIISSGSRQSTKNVLNVPQSQIPITVLTDSGVSDNGGICNSGNSNHNVLMRDYTDSSFNINIDSTGTITPSFNTNINALLSGHNSDSNSSSSSVINHNNDKNSDDNKSSSAIFKPFDPKTGQFVNDHNMEIENFTNNNENNNQKPKTDINDAPVPLNYQRHIEGMDVDEEEEEDDDEEEESEDEETNLLPTMQQLRTHSSSLQTHKFRSQSVPTILHSSLKTLTNFQQHHLRNNPILINSNSNRSNINIHIAAFTKSSTDNMKSSNINSNTNDGLISTSIYQHPIISQAGIKKRKYTRSHRSILRATTQSTASTSIPSTQHKSNLKNSSVLNIPKNNNSDNNLQSRHSQLLNTQRLHLYNDSIKNNLNDLSMDERITYIKSFPSPLPLPPINLQCLKEIDLQEIVKNPQLRHDIIFDPLLQFRPNLDGERGVKKSQLSDKYWNDVENELHVYIKRPDIFDYKHTRLVPLFDTLRDVLLTTVPQKESHMINGVLDTELTVQEIIKGSLQMSNFSDWLSQLFKHHCAPMRDTWVDKMHNKFREAESESSLPKLIKGLRLVFQILEAMKLDIANHQIRILRPALLSNAVEFEKQYFLPLLNSNKIDLKSSLVWFNSKFEESVSLNLIKSDESSPQDVYRLCIKSIISLLSCRKMVRSYPTALTFDHTRLILLRADLRQIVCLMVCRLLFQQLVASDTTMNAIVKEYVNKTYTTKNLKRDIVSIITDEHGNCRWTKNIMSIAVHLCKVISDLKIQYANKDKAEEIDKDIGTIFPSLDNTKINFAKSWLSKQTQPLSDVYGVLENRVFKSLGDTIYTNSGCTLDGRVKQDFIYLCSTTGNTTSEDASTTNRTNMEKEADKAENSNQQFRPFNSILNNNQSVLSSVEMEEFENVYRHLYTVVNFHWSVFGSHYMESLGDKMKEKVI